MRTSTDDKFAMVLIAKLTHLRFARRAMWKQDNRQHYNRDKLRYPSDLTDSKWSFVEALIPPALPTFCCFSRSSGSEPDQK